MALGFTLINLMLCCHLCCWQ